MGIYYHKLWSIMNDRGITQKQISQKTGISAATFSKMRNGEYVSLEILDRIRMVLDCDYGDMITSVPEANMLNVDWRNDNISVKANAIHREVLLRQMDAEGLSPAQVAERTGLSLNTVKGFLKGKPISSNSMVKLMRLGKDYNHQLNLLIGQYGILDVTYCQKPIGRSRHCKGLRWVYHPETKEYEHYCIFDFPVEYDDEGQLITRQRCPHPKTLRDMEEALEKYGNHLRNPPIMIPAVDENTKEVALHNRLLGNHRED